MLENESLHDLQFIDTIRKNHRSCVTNIFMNAHELVEMLKKDTQVFRLDDRAIFFMVPFHHAYYDVFFTCASEAYEKLYEEASFLDFIRNLDLPVRVGLTGNYDRVNEYARVFKACGFIQNKVVGKVTSGAPISEYAAHFLASNANASEEGNISEKGKSDSGDDSNTFFKDVVVTFPDVSEAEEIFELLCEEFDLIGDNVPEVEQIRKDIQDHFVAVLKKDNNIIAVSYNQIKNRIRSCIYEYVKKDFRGGGAVFLLNSFINKYFSENENIVRTYGWRDVSKKRLINVYRSFGETFTGVYTAYLVFN